MATIAVLATNLQLLPLLMWLLWGSIKHKILLLILTLEDYFETIQRLITKFLNIMKKDIVMINLLLSLLDSKKCEKSTCFQTSARSFIHSFWKMSACEKIARISLVFFNLIILGISGCLIFAAVVFNNEIYDLFIPSYEVSFKILTLNHKRHRIHRPPPAWSTCAMRT